MLFLKIARSFFRYFLIRKRLRRGLRENKEEIKRNKGYENGQYQVYKQIYNSVAHRNAHYSNPRKREKFEQRVNKELNRMIKNPFTKFYSFLLSFVKGTLSTILLLMVLLFGSIVMDEYKAANLTLPTIDPNVQVKLNTDLSEVSGKLFKTMLGQGPDLPEFTYASIDDEKVMPIYKDKAYPEAITNVAQLGQAFAYHMSNFDSEFTVQYRVQHLGDFQKFNETLEEMEAWLNENEIYLSRLRRETNYVYYDYGKYIELQVAMNYDMTAEQNAIVNGVVEEIAAAVPDGLTDAEKVKYVNDYLVKHTKYNLESEESPYTPYSILMNGEGVCEGYALSALLLLRELDVEVKYISGEAVPGGLHAWNLVKLDGEWYHLDVTWNDPVPDQGDNVRYDYFLLAENKIAKDHHWDTSLYPEGAVADFW